MKWDQISQQPTGRLKWDDLGSAPSEVPRETQKSTVENVARVVAQPAVAFGKHALDTISNVPESAGRFIGGIARAVTSPIETGKAIGKTAVGGLQLATHALGLRKEGSLPADEDFRSQAEALGKHVSDRYGGMDKAMETFKTDPVGFLADLSTVLTGAGAVAGAANLPKVSGALKAAATATNPMVPIGKAVGATAKLTGKAAANLIGGLGTHTGGSSLQEAAKSGFRGGKAQADLISNMRSKVPMTDVLDDVKSNIEAMGRVKSAQYRSGMAQVSGDKTILGFDGIDRAVKNLSDSITYKGQVKNAKAAEIGRKITDEVERWKQLDPSDFHTPEGLDALKQRIGGIIESVPFEEKTARMVGNGIYRAIKDEITKQAPVYAKVMKQYTDASDEIREIERALSVGKTASVDTAMRKLQSLMRNNANTNYGNRLDLAKKLEEAGGSEFMPALAGQSLNTWTPRGLGNVVAGGLGLGGYAVGGPVLAGATLAVQSPRLMGEAALKAGQAGRYAKNAFRRTAPAAPMVYQAGQVRENDRKSR